MAPSPHGSSVRPTPRDEVISSASDDLSTLRQLLLAPERTQLQQLERQLQDMAVHPHDVSRVLPEAIVLRSKQDAQLTTSLAPIIERALEHSITKSPNIIVDVMSPVIGPAIRKATMTALRSMMQGLNQTLEHSLSWKGLQWRMEAYRTGKPFSEVVLLHTLRFRVEQVLLIDRETGLLLQQVTADLVQAQDEDVVSGMLTAIQDFVRDSFGGAKSDALESLRVGDLTVWVEQGPKAILAGIIRGTPPVEVREVFQEVLEAVHVECREAFDLYRGDPSVFGVARPHLEDCLQAQFEQRDAKPPLVLWVGLAVLVTGLVAWGIIAYQDRQRWETFHQLIEKEPGVVVTEFDRVDGQVVVRGLRDPLAADPEPLVDQAGLDPENTRLSFQSYLSMDPVVVERRARQRLEPPGSVTMAVDQGVLHVSGRATHAWIRRVERTAETIPGIAQVTTKQLIDTDMKQFEELKERIEKQVLLFEAGSDRFLSDDEHPALGLSAMVETLDRLAQVLGYRIVITAHGSASHDGPVGLNQRLSEQRADVVAEVVRRSTLGATTIVTQGITIEELTNPEDDRGHMVSDRQVNMSVMVHPTSGEGIPIE